jgi:hypothetical protein
MSERMARAIHDAHSRAARARQRPHQPWSQLAGETRAQLESDASKLADEYAAAGDPPSYGIGGPDDTWVDSVVTELVGAP